MNHTISTSTGHSVLCIVTADMKQLQDTTITGRRHYHKFTVREKLSADQLFHPGHMYELNLINGKFLLPFNGMNLVIPNKIVDRYA